MVVRRWQASLLLVALLPQAAGLADDAAAKAAAERDARALGWLIQGGIRVFVQPGDPAKPGAAGRGRGPGARRVIDDQLRQQIDQQAKPIEQQFQILLNGELELIRRTCGGLAPDARRQVLTAGREATAATARGFAERQLTGQHTGHAFDPRREIRTALQTAVERAADPAEFAAYQAELERREARRAEAARAVIVARVDRQLELSAGQRERIEAELAKHWQADWSRELGVRRDMRINGMPPAPDCAAVAIEPHLGPDQVAGWKQWLKQAGSRRVYSGWDFDGQGPQQPDPWWGR